MRALDNLLTQARRLRIARAKRVAVAIAAAGARAEAEAAELALARAEGRAPRPIEAVGPAPSAEPEDWLDECAAAQLVLAGLADPNVPDDRRRTRAIGVLDLAPAAPFVARAVEVLTALVDEMAPHEAVLAAMWPRLCAHVAPFGTKDPEGYDAGRVRRAAAADVAVLAVESLLFEVVRGAMRANDARRSVAHRPDLGEIVVADGKVRRVARPKARERDEAAARAKANRATLGRSVGDLAAVPAERRGAGKRKTRVELRAEGRARRLAREAAGAGPGAEAASGTRAPGGGASPPDEARAARNAKRAADRAASKAEFRRLQALARGEAEDHPVTVDVAGRVDDGPVVDGTLADDGAVAVTDVAETPDVTETLEAVETLETVEAVAADEGVPDQGVPDQGVPDQGVPDQGDPVGEAACVPTAADGANPGQPVEAGPG